MERRLQASYDESVRVAIVDGTKEYLASYVMPHYAELEKRYRDIMESRTGGIMDRKTYRLILSCLHTDSRAGLPVMQSSMKRSTSLAGCKPN